MTTQAETQDHNKTDSYSVVALDDYLPDDVYSAVRNFLKGQARYHYEWYSDRSVSAYSHWHIDFLDKGNENQENCEQLLHSKAEFKAIADVWNFLKDGPLQGHGLVRCYANAHTYGVEGYPHTDTLTESNYTALIYICDNWKPEWAGETVFFDDAGDIHKAFMPKANRTVLFEGRQLHTARAVSRICSQLRITLVFKTRAPGVEFEFSAGSLD